MSRKTMLLMTLIGQLASGELRAQIHGRISTPVFAITLKSRWMRRFTDNSLHDFAGQKQLRLKTHGLKGDRFVFASGPLGWSGWMWSPSNEPTCKKNV